MDIAIEYNCQEWNYETIRTAMRMSSNDIPDQIDSIVVLCDFNKIKPPNNKTLLKHLKKNCETLSSASSLDINDIIDSKAVITESRIACYVRITPRAIDNRKPHLKARRYMTLVHLEPLEEFDWSNE